MSFNPFIELFLDWVTPSTIKPLQKSISRTSIDAFNRKSAANEIINSLKYFTQSYEPYHHQPGKDAFSWGQVNFFFHFFTFWYIIVNPFLEEYKNIWRKPHKNL